ncbi:hypothetical protein EYF80_049665 [Liparis tanakae]|uniref:Uncharacterized protein n=1 Tax=Liparis tanakae TaxID=230148 RepID=A0A4Z2FGY0_9TELE|nr:hypothetical protein EYF80_049665 [Liparis tanakae]
MQFPFSRKPLNFSVAQLPVSSSPAPGALRSLSLTIMKLLTSGGPSASDRAMRIADYLCAHRRDPHTDALSASTCRARHGCRAADTRRCSAKSTGTAPGNGETSPDRRRKLHVGVLPVR